MRVISEERGARECSVFPLSPLFVSCTLLRTLLSLDFDHFVNLLIPLHSF